MEMAIVEGPSTIASHFAMDSDGLIFYFRSPSPGASSPASHVARCLVRTPHLLQLIPQPIHFWQARKKAGGFRGGLMAASVSLLVQQLHSL